MDKIMYKNEEYDKSYIGKKLKAPNNTATINIFSSDNGFNYKTNVFARQLDGYDIYGTCLNGDYYFLTRGNWSSYFVGIRIRDWNNIGGVFNSALTHLFSRLRGVQCAR